MARVNEKTVHFGAIGYEDYTTHRDEKRKASYLARHRTKEDWTLSGVDTACFWALHLLWNEPSLSASVADVNRRFKTLSVKMR